MSKGLFAHTNGFTSIDNDIFYIQSKISSSAFSVLMRIYRSTQGYAKPVVAISGVFLQKTTGLTKNTVTGAVKELEKLKLILVKRRARMPSYFQISIKQVISLADETKALLNQEPESLEMDLEEEEVTLESPVVEEEEVVSEEKVLHDVGFDIFWSVYDKSVAKAQARKYWDKLPQEDKKDIMATLEDYVQSTPEKKFRKDPANYLKNRVWEDEIVKVVSAPTGSYNAPVTHTEADRPSLPQYKVDSPVQEKREVVQAGSEADNAINEFLNRNKSKGSTYVN